MMRVGTKSILFGVHNFVLHPPLVGIAWWRLYAPLMLPLARRLASQWGRVSRWLRWPIAAWEPWRWAELHVARHDNLGDVLMATPALRELKRRNPG